jgi:hypothetical protein
MMQNKIKEMQLKQTQTTNEQIYTHIESQNEAEVPPTEQIKSQEASD